MMSKNPFLNCASPVDVFATVNFVSIMPNTKLSRCKKIDEGITMGADPKNPDTFEKLNDISGGQFSTSSGFLSLFLHYGEDPISRNTVSKAIFQVGIVLQKKDPSGFFCPDPLLEPGGVCV